MNILERLNSVRLKALLALALCGSLSSLAGAACDLKVISAYPAKLSGGAYNPKFGESYYLQINWQVVGTPKAPYSILFEMAGQTYKWTGITAGSGYGYYGVAGFFLELDGPIPWTITLDPDHVTGDTNTANNVISGTLTPTPPTSPIEYFNPVTRIGTQTTSVNWNVGGTVTSGYTVMGAPATGSFQTVVKSTDPTGSKLVVTTPDADPVWETTRTNYKPTSASHQWLDTTNFTVISSAARSNINALKKVTWAQEAAVSSTYTPYTKPDLLVQSTDATVTAFVKSVLPANYKTTMTPYDAAKALYMAVVKRTVYQTPAAQDSKTTLSLRKGDCGSFTNLCCACYRSIGIPARANTGFWIGTNQWHVKGEFYLQGLGWVPFDASESRLFDTSGTYPYYFGSDASLNQFCAVGRGDDHRTTQFAITYTQVGWLLDSGTASYQPYGTICSLK